MLEVNCHTLPRLVLCGRFRQRRGWNHDGRTMQEHLLMVMWQGDCQLSVEEQSYHLQSGNAVIIPAGQYYRPHTEDGCEYYYFHFVGAPVLPDTPSERIIRLPVFVSALQEQRQEILLAAQRIFDAQFDEALPEAALTAELLLTQLLLQLAGISAKDGTCATRAPTLLSKMVLYIKQHATEKTTLAELSSHFSVSKQYITRLFRQHMSTTPTAYIHRVKLESARWLLTHSTMNVSEISDYLGFSGSYYFIRLFKKYYNITPLQYARERLERS